MRTWDQIHRDRNIAAARIEIARSRLVVDHGMTRADADGVIGEILAAVADLTAPLCLLEPAPDEIKAVSDDIGIAMEVSDD